MSSRDSQNSEGESSTPSVLKTIIANNQAKEGFKTIHVVAYILTAVLAREYSGWQPALSTGLGMFGIAQFCTAFANLNYYLCLAEIWSAIPFSGGSYALSRATLGFWLGFLDGSCEAIIYVIHAALAAEALGDKLCLLFEINPHYTLMFCFIMFFIALVLTVQKSLVVLRRTYMTIAGVSLLIVLIWCFGSMHWSDFNQNATLHKTDNFSSPANWFNGGFKEWITILPATLLPYAGTRSFAILTNVTEKPKSTLPRAIVIAFSIVFFLNMMVIFINASQPGGIEHTSGLTSPMKVGWQLMFKIKSAVELFRVTGILSIPASFGKVLAYILPGGLLLFSLGKSNLLPSIFCVNRSKDRTTGSIVLVTLSMIFCIFQHYFPQIDMYNVVVMLTKLTDCSFLYGYVLMKTKFSTLEREFTNPFGIAGAVFAFCMFVLTFISAGFYQGSYFPPQFLAIYFAAGSIYYWVFAKRSETLCEEEDRVFLKIHVRNYNIAKKKKNHQASNNGGWRSKFRVSPGGKYKVHSSNGDSHPESSSAVGYSQISVSAPRYTGPGPHSGETTEEGNDADAEKGPHHEAAIAEGQEGEEIDRGYSFSQAVGELEGHAVCVEEVPEGMLEKEREDTVVEEMAVMSGSETPVLMVGAENV